MTKSAILHESFLLPFLKISMEEGLIEKFDDNISDGLYSKIIRSKYRKEYRESLLEQVVLTPELFFLENKYYETYIKGPIVDNETIKFIKPIQPELIQAIPISPIPFILNIMNAYEEKYKIEDCEKFKDILINTVKEQTEYTQASKKSIPSNMELIIQDILLKGATKSKDYSEDEINLFNKWKNSLSEISQFTSATSSFINLYNASVEKNCLLKIPVFASPESSNKTAEADELVILRIICKELDVHSYKPSLTGSIKLSKEPATVALREYINLWKDSLYDQDNETAIKIKAEVKIANEFINKIASRGQNTSKFVTYISVPMMYVDNFILHFAPMVGISATIIGFLGQYISDLPKSNYRWAMFNSK